MRILINGICGKMGGVLYNLVKNNKYGIEVLEGVDNVENTEKLHNMFPDVHILNDINSSHLSDIVVDFSSPSSLDNLLEFCKTRHLPLVIATTGHSREQLDKMLQYSSFFPIFKSANMSQGITAMLNVIKTLSQNLNEWDVEIVEYHHKGKIDAPSGTAIEMFNAVKSVRPESNMVVSRTNGIERYKNDVGVMSVRGGSIVGRHDMSFIADNEIITISHEALSKDVFARGALNACKFLINKDKGFYTNKNLFE